MATNDKRKKASLLTEGRTSPAPVPKQKKGFTPPAPKPSKTGQGSKPKK